MGVPCFAVCAAPDDIVWRSDPVVAAGAIRAPAGSMVDGLRVIC
jgi:hypothetical protein